VLFQLGDRTRVFVFWIDLAAVDFFATQHDDAVVGLLARLAENNLRQRVLRYVDKRSALSALPFVS
jgi:hypothetical protein